MMIILQKYENELNKHELNWIEYNKLKPHAQPL